MSNDKIDYIYEEVKELRKDIKDIHADIKGIHSDVVVLKTEKKTSSAILTVLISTVTTFLYKIADTMFK